MLKIDSWLISNTSNILSTDLELERAGKGRMPLLSQLCVLGGEARRSQFTVVLRPPPSWRGFTLLISTSLALALSWGRWRGGLIAGQPQLCNSERDEKVTQKIFWLCCCHRIYVSSAKLDFGGNGLLGR